MQKGETKEISEVQEVYMQMRRTELEKKAYQQLLLSLLGNTETQKEKEKKARKSNATGTSTEENGLWEW